MCTTPRSMHPPPTCTNGETTMFGEIRNDDGHGDPMVSEQTIGTSPYGMVGKEGIDYLLTVPPTRPQVARAIPAFVFLELAKRSRLY